MGFQKGHKNFNVKKEQPQEEAVEEAAEAVLGGRKIDPEIEAEMRRLLSEYNAKAQVQPTQTPIHPTEFREVPNYHLPQVEDGSVTPVKVGQNMSRGDNLKLAKNPTSSYVITMLFGNGTMEHYVIETKENFFILNKKRYHLNKTLGWYDVNFKNNRLIYFEEYVEPIEHGVKFDGDKTFLYITPSNMQPVMEMEYVKILSQSAELTKWLKILIFIGIASLCLMLINTIIFVVQSGILQSLMKGVKGG
jgi:hypothetical protein